MTDERNLILTVCTGNVCRSPMAEKLLQHALAAQAPPLNQLEVASAGVAAAYGDPPSRNSVSALKRVKLDLSQHRSQPLTEDLIARAFAIFVMTRSHLDILERHYDGLPDRVHLFREFMPGDGDDEIPDPFGQDLRAYSACSDAIVEAIPSLIDYLQNEYTAT